MYTGAVITQSLKPGSELTGVPLVVDRLVTFDKSDAAENQPTRWTMIFFRIDDADAERLASWFADSLISEPGVWYADFRNDAEHFVIFPGRIFRYRLDDHDARQQAVDHGRRLGVPEAQLDWDD